MKSQHWRHWKLAGDLFLGFAGASGLWLAVTLLGTDWFLDNPLDHWAGFPLYLLLPVVLSATFAWVLARQAAWEVWLLSFGAALVAYVGCGLIWFGVQPSQSIGIFFSVIAYLPVTALTAVLACRVAQRRR